MNRRKPIRWIAIIAVILIPSLCLSLNKGNEDNVTDGVNKNTKWGDQGDGTFVNPLLNADFSDPDVIRVGQKYYMVCSEFHFMGMPVLESDDMVNWKIISQVYNAMDFPEYDINKRYGGGSWAPAIRYHDGKFWVYFCTPDEGLFMSNASNPAGPWAPLLNVQHIAGWEDPCPFWDEDGQVYLGRSRVGAGPIIVHKMSADGTQLLDDGITVYEGPVAEGTKIHKIDNYYYMSIPEGGVERGWQTILRSEDIYGPYERRVILEEGASGINGPHQGALVDTPEGEWWFYHFQATNPLGRVVHLQPVTWIDGWPFIGIDIDNNGIGEPVKTYRNPLGKTKGKIFAPQGSDEFNSPQLNLQWQFNHNPVSEKWSLNKRPGYLSIEALKADSLREARNIITQKIIGYKGEAVVQLDCKNLADGQRAGLCTTGRYYKGIGVLCKEGKRALYYDGDGIVEHIAPVEESIIYLKVTCDALNNHFKLHYSLDGKVFIPYENTYDIPWWDWKGGRIGLFSYNTQSEHGCADFNWFRYEYDGPGLKK